MSQINKTDAFVLSKLDYGDTSSIASLFTKDFGKLSAIIKGGRNPKSKISLIVDPLNQIEVVFYSKDTREIQLLSSASLINHYSHIKEDFEKLKYCHAILELVKNLTAEHEVYTKLYKGIDRIFYLFDTSNEQPEIIFGRFFIFMLTEIGYEIQLNKCAACGKSNQFNTQLSYNYEIGILCDKCKEKFIGSYSFNSELFYYLLCLKNNKMVDTKIKQDTLKDAIVFMERFLKHHVPDFKGIKSFQIYN